MYAFITSTPTLTNKAQINEIAYALLASLSCVAATPQATLQTPPGRCWTPPLRHACCG
jgi:hypothetical protein